jgi:hypothetical protein
LIQLKAIIPYYCPPRKSPSFSIRDRTRQLVAWLPASWVRERPWYGFRGQQYSSIRMNPCPILASFRSSFVNHRPEASRYLFPLSRSRDAGLSRASRHRGTMGRGRSEEAGARGLPQGSFPARNSITGETGNNRLIANVP